MGKIVLLDDLTINQIAAGEVIERPASVVKELVENSIDAGAKNITIDIKNGGISYIRITDNGSGILPDDMEIAFERHATSKIRSADDLDEVKSMGFRGEALASIAAIAKVDLVSKAIGQDNGYEVVMEGGDIKEKHEAGCAQGTSITITELFYNTPVRYKFLKKDFTETGYIEEIIQRIALANPNVSIKLVDTGKTTIQTTGSGKIEDAIYAIFGKEIVENILPVEYMYEDLHITGVIGKPIISRSNRSNQLFYVNHRFIKDKTLTSASVHALPVKGFVSITRLYVPNEFVREMLSPSL
jgi:DNA mismatch repair protein MutL